MKKALIASIPLFLIIGVFALPVRADDTLAEFEGGIGVIPVSSGVGVAATATTVNRNIVRGVQPAGQIWVIRKLEAEVKTNGEIRVEGEGLVLGGGNSIGRATGQRVFVTLICEAVALFTEHNSTLAGVPLEANGDFRINDVLSPAPPIRAPARCSSSATRTCSPRVGLPLAFSRATTAISDSSGGEATSCRRCLHPTA
jgi:hypothetical protein